jgi:hypothetical protein
LKMSGGLSVKFVNRRAGPKRYDVFSHVLRPRGTSTVGRIEKSRRRLATRLQS